MNGSLMSLTETETRRRTVFDRRRDIALRVVVTTVFVGVFGFFTILAAPRDQSWMDKSAYDTAITLLFWIFLGSFATGFVGMCVGVLVEGIEIKRRDPSSGLGTVPPTITR